MDTHTEKCLANYLTGRHAYTLYNDKPSTTNRYIDGVPQGSVQSVQSLHARHPPTSTPGHSHTLIRPSDSQNEISGDFQEISRRSEFFSRRQYPGFVTRIHNFHQTKSKKKYF